MKLHRTFFRALFISALSLGSQLVCQQAPEITYHASIAPLAQHAAQIIAPRLFKESYNSDFETQVGKVSSAYVYVNSAKEALVELRDHSYLPVAQVLTPESCIAHDNSDALSYCFEQTYAGSTRKSTQSLKQLANYAIEHNAPWCLQMLIDRVDSPRQLTTELQFLDAIKNGRVDCVRILLPYNNPEAVYQGYGSPLKQAFRSLEEAEKNVPIFTGTMREEYSKKTRDYEHMISFLIDEIPNIIKQKEGDSVLSMATMHNAPASLVKKIIAADSTNSLINPEHDDCTPLYYAVDNALESKNNTVVELLLAKGANPNIGKNRPLALAIQGLRPDLVHMLGQAGATPTRKALLSAIKQLKKSTQTTQAAAYENLEILIPVSTKELLGKPEILNQLVITALARNKVSLISLAHKQDVDLQQPLNEKGETALHIAITYKSIEAVEALLQAGCNPEVTTKEEETPLSYTAWCEKQSTTTPCMERLLAANVALDKANIRGNTALHIAAYNNNCHGTFLLLKHGADQDIKNNVGKTAYEIAQSGAKAIFDSFTLNKKAR
jgi:ankyrin repeat protein